MNAVLLARSGTVRSITHWISDAWIGGSLRGKRWSLAITFPRFTGRHRYEIPFGSSDTDPHVTFTGPDGEFSSLNQPPRSFSGPGFVTLGPRGAVQLGDGYIANQDFSGSVAAVGTIHCPVPRPRKGR